MSKKSILLGAAAVLLCGAVIAGGIILRNANVRKRLDEKLDETPLLPAPPSEAEEGRDCIHFLPTGSSDAILLESDGHFAMVDCGEDTDNPRNLPGLALPGFEQEVLAYIKKVAADENGKVRLDFVLGTHSHSDHLGGFDTVIADPDVTVDKAYLKVYDASKIHASEIEEWDNQEVYDQTVNALRGRGVPIVSDLSEEPFTFGNLTLTLVNAKDPETKKTVGENDQSLCLLIEKNGTRVFLAADLDNYSSDERRLAPAIGRVDLLKIGHHSYSGSSSAGFIRALRPAACVITNRLESVDRRNMSRVERIASPAFYVTGREKGVLAVLRDNGQISYYGQLWD